MYLFDRINQKRISNTNIKSPILLGQFIDDKQRYLVPCINLVGKLIDNTEVVFEENSFINNNSSLISNSFIEISNEVNLIEDVSSVQDINTMLRNFDERLEVNEYDQLMHDKLFHLEEICRQPSYHLNREVTKVNISRAKRITVRSINYLAAHSEDWSRRRIRGVEPKKILSETIEYDLRIYENKVTTKLIDKLLQYCSNRIINDIEVVEVLMNKVDSILESIKNQGNGSVEWYKKRERDYFKLGSIVEKSDESKKQLKQLKDFILKIQNRLFALLGSELYLKNRNAILSSDTIDRTNLFDSHQHYRFVKIIWNKWNKLSQRMILNCDEISENNFLIIKSFIDYAYLIILKSFNELGFIQEGTFSNEYCTLVHKNYDFKVTIERDINDIFTIKINGKDVKLIPVLADIGIDDYAIDKDTFFIVPESENRNNHRLIVSPDDINSEERVTKVLFKYILKEHINNYLYAINSQILAPFSILKEWFLNHHDIAIDLGKMNKLDLYIKSHISREDLKDFEQKISEQKNNLPQHQMRVQQLKNIEAIHQLVMGSLRHFEKYFTCLGCGQRNAKNLNTIQNSFNYSCNNTGCEVKYGTINNKVFYAVKNLAGITGDLDDKIGYENIHEE